MLVCIPDVMSHKRKAISLPEGIANSKRRHLNHETTICVEHKASLTLPPPQRKKMNGAHVNSPIRRQASLNAQIALQLLLDESPPTSPVPVENGAYLVSSDPSFSTEIVPGPIPEPAVIHVTPEPTPEPDENYQTTVAATTALNMAHCAALDDATLNCGVVLDSPPASTTSSDGDIKEVCERQLSYPASLRLTKLKKPVINVVDCKNVVLSNRKKPATPMNTCKPSVQVDSSGFVKRMASLNARARVTALIEPEKKYARQKPHHELQQKGTHDPPVGLKSESVLQKSAPHHLHNSEIQLCRSTGGAAVAIKSPPPEAYHSDASISVIPHTGTVVPDGAQEGNAEVVAFNSLGLLYNGSTVHPDTRVFLTSKGMLPARIIPIVVPPKANSLHLMEYVQNAREQHKGKARKPRAQKGDNGWTCLGNPIKTIIRIEGDVRVARKYYIGIRRKDEEVFVRDCVVVKSGKKKQDKPFLAKIASIWQETGNIMMTVFWYYTPDDIEGINMADFQEDEVLASQHHDDNGVACIEDKCYILGFREYCRYQAVVHRREANSAPVVPDLNSKEENSEQQYPLLENVDPSLVFLCYQGYNHVSGKVDKGSK